MTATAFPAIIAEISEISEPQLSPPDRKGRSFTDDLLDHPVLDPATVAVLTRLNRRANTLLSIQEQLPPQYREEPEASLAVASYAIEALDNRDADVAERCREILPEFAGSIRAEDVSPTALIPQGGWYAYWRQLLHQGQQARETLTRCNQRLVRTIALRYTYSPLELEDLIQEGNTGLIRAIDRFDETTGNRFSTYATWWIRQAIQRGIAKNSRTIRLPDKVHSRVPEVLRIHATQTDHNGHPPTFREISEITGVSVIQVEAILFHSQPLISLEESSTNLDAYDSFHSLTPDHWLRPAPSSEDHAMAKSVTYDLRRAIEKLDPRSQTVIRCRFGIDDHDELTLAELGKIFEITRERVRQIEAKALKQLKSLILHDGLDLYLDQIHLAAD